MDTSQKSELQGEVATVSVISRAASAVVQVLPHQQTEWSMVGVKLVTLMCETDGK